MKVELRLRELTVAELIAFYMLAREKDLVEVKHMTGTYFTDVLINDLKDSVCLYDQNTGEVYAIGGVDNRLIWMLCTCKVEQHPYPFLLFCQKQLKDWLRQYPYLHNWVWLKNIQHVKWLKWMGAVFDSEVKTVNGQPFQHFTFKGGTD